VLHKYIHYTPVSLLNTTGMTNIMIPFHNYVDRNARTARRLINVDSELRRLQTKSPHNFGLYSSAVSGGKERDVCCLMQLHIMSSSVTT